MVNPWTITIYSDISMPLLQAMLQVVFRHGTTTTPRMTQQEVLSSESGEKYSLRSPYTSLTYSAAWIGRSGVSFSS